MGYGAEQGQVVGVLGGGNSARYAAENAFSPAQPPTPAQISVRLDELNSLTERLHERISQLEGRLEGVTRPAPPNGAGADGKVEPMVAPLARMLRDQGVRVGMAINRLDELMLRLDL